MIPGITAGVSATPLSPLVGALVYPSVNQLQSGATLIPMGAEVYDYGGFHDNAVNNSRLIVPQTGVYRTAANMRQGNRNNPFTYIRKNGVETVGLGHRRFSEQATVVTHHNNVASAPISMSASDYFDSVSGNTSGTGTNVGNDPEVWLCVEEFDPALRRCLVTNSEAQTGLPNGVYADLTFDTIVGSDVGGFRTGSAAEFVMPFTGRARLIGNCNSNSGSGVGRLQIIRTVGTPYGLPQNIDDSNFEIMNVASAPIDVTLGDVFKLQYNQNVAGLATDGSVRNWFSVEEVPDDYICALLRKSANQNVTATAAPIQWEQYVYRDDAAMFDAGVDNTVIVAPINGFARQSWNLGGSNNTGAFYGRGLMNGAAYFGMPCSGTDTGGSDYVGAMGAWVPCVIGDEFSLEARCPTTHTVGDSPNTWMAMEFRPA